MSAFKSSNADNTFSKFLSISDLTVQYTLKGHSRLVTDVDWNDSDPNVLVTASHDNYLHVWDVRSGSITM